MNDWWHECVILENAFLQKMMFYSILERAYLRFETAHLKIHFIYVQGISWKPKNFLGAASRSLSSKFRVSRLVLSSWSLKVQSLVIDCTIHRIIDTEALLLFLNKAQVWGMSPSVSRLKVSPIRRYLTELTTVILRLIRIGLRNRYVLRILCWYIFPSLGSQKLLLSPQEKSLKRSGLLLPLFKL